VRTLYAEDVSGQYTPGSKSAYKHLVQQQAPAARADRGRRQRRHAARVHAGNWQADAGTFDDGTGSEVWAFIPPDLVPKAPALTR